jgi:hypothetical protein
MRLKEHALSLILYQLGCRTRKSGHNFSHGLQVELPGASWRILTRWIFCVVWPAWSIEPLKGEAQNAALSTARHTIGGQEHWEIVCMNCSTFLLYRVSHSARYTFIRASATTFPQQGIIRSFE